MLHAMSSYQYRFRLMLYGNRWAGNNTSLVGTSTGTCSRMLLWKKVSTFTLKEVNPLSGKFRFHYLPQTPPRQSFGFLALLGSRSQLAITKCASPFAKPWIRACTLLQTLGKGHINQVLPLGTLNQSYATVPLLWKMVGKTSRLDANGAPFCNTSG